VALAKEVDVVKGKIEEKKLEGGESMDELCTWRKEIDAKIEGVDTEIEYLGRHLRATAHKYGPNNGTSRKIDFAHFLPKDWP